MQIEDGRLIGHDEGEFGDNSIWWENATRDLRKKLVDKPPLRFFRLGDHSGYFALVAARLYEDRAEAQILEFVQRGGGVPEISRVLPLLEEPQAWDVDGERLWWATGDGLYSFDYRRGIHEVVDDPPWVAANAALKRMADETNRPQNLVVVTSLYIRRTSVLAGTTGGVLQFDTRDPTATTKWWPSPSGEE